VPPAVVAAGITGATTLGGALIGSGAQKNAAKHQANANRDAMSLERERLAEDRRRYDQAYTRYEQDRANYDAARRAILAKHGYDIPAAQGAPAASGGLSLSNLAGATPPVQTGTAFWGGASSGGMPPTPEAAPMPSSGPVSATPQGVSLGEMTSQDWDWRKYAAG